VSGLRACKRRDSRPGIEFAGAHQPATLADREPGESLVIPTLVRTAQTAGRVAGAEEVVAGTGLPVYRVRSDWRELAVAAG
jgi:hypothetical protein